VSDPTGMGPGREGKQEWYDCCGHDTAINGVQIPHKTPLTKKMVHRGSVWVLKMSESVFST